MKSFRSSIAAFALLALAAASSAVSIGFGHVAASARAVYRFACDFLACVPAKFAEPALKQVSRPVEMVQACAYALRLAKRDRPHLTPSWRMCPSI